MPASEISVVGSGGEAGKIDCGTSELVKGSVHSMLETQSWTTLESQCLNKVVIKEHNM